MDAQNEKTYSPKEVAEKLNVSRTAVYQWIQSGELKAERKPSVRRKPEHIIKQSDLTAFLNGRGINLTL